MSSIDYKELRSCADDWNNYYYQKELTGFGLFIYPILLPLIGIALAYFLETSLEFEKVKAYGLVFGILIPLIIWRVWAGMSNQLKASSQLKSHGTELLRAMEKTVRRVASLNPKRDKNTISFETIYKTPKGGTWKYHWKGEFVDDKMILVRLPKNEIYFLDRHEFTMSEMAGQRGLMGKYQPATLVFGKRRDPANVPLDSYEKLRCWKRGQCIS